MTPGIGTTLALVYAALLAAGLVLGFRQLRDLHARILGTLSALALWALICDVSVFSVPDETTLWTPGAVQASTTATRWDPSAPGALRSLLELPPATGSVSVRGYGLPAALWDEARVLPIAHEPPAPPPGIHELSWPEHATLGTTVVIRGRADLDDGLLRASVDGVALGETRIDDGAFELSLPTLPLGRALIDLAIPELPGAGEILAIEITPPPTLRVDGDFGAPSPDLRAFRDWLQAGGDVRGRLRTTLAPGIEREETLGPGEPSPETPVDLLLVDARGPEAERRIEAAVAAARDGAGALILHRGGNAQLPGGFHVTPIAAPRTVAVALASGPQDALVTGELVADAEAQVLVSSTDGRPLVQARRLGRGWIAVSVLEGTASWALQGRGDAHARSWSDLVAFLARPRSPALAARHAELVATVGFRTDLCHGGNEAIQPDPAPSAPLLSVTATEGWRCDAWWPETTGWHRVGQRWLHVHDVESFWSARARTRLAATSARMRASDDGWADGAGVRRAEGERSAWWVLFILSSLALWWRSRLIT